MRLLPSLLLVSAVSLLGSAGRAQGELESMGRLELGTDSCDRNLVIIKTAGPCARVVIDQLDREYLSVSFYGRGPVRGSSNKLTFGGTASRGMACKRTSCSISGPINLELSSASEVDFDANGVAKTLPSAWPVIGTCSIDRRAVRCQAKALMGETWTANASL
jgi:hypothetical protein